MNGITNTMKQTPVIEIQAHAVIRAVGQQEKSKIIVTILN
jgi:hypothetical protein